MRRVDSSGELVNGRAAASSSLAYGPSAYSLRACRWRRGLLGRLKGLAPLGELVNGRAAASSSLACGPSAYSLRACRWRRGLLALLLVAAAVAVAGCGPDCDRFCAKLFECGQITDRARCVQGCDEVGGDRAAYINCVVDPSHTCQDIAPTTGAHCSLPQ